MSKTDKMDAKDAEGYTAPFIEFFNSEDFADIDPALASNKKTDEAIIKMIISKYPDSDSKVSFDPSGRTMLLMLMRVIYGSANINGFNNDTNPTALPNGFKPGTLQYNLWTWIAGLINDHGDWNDIKMSEIPPHFEDVSELYCRDDHKMDERCTVFAHTVFSFIIDSIGSKIAKLFSDTTECGAKGLTIKGYMLRGYFNDMNPGAANPEVFMMLYNAAVAFSVVKKDWAAISKEIKKKAREDAKAIKEAEKKRKDAAKLESKSAAK